MTRGKTYFTFLKNSFFFLKVFIILDFVKFAQKKPWMKTMRMNEDENYKDENYENY